MDVLGELVGGHLHAALHRLGSVANRDYLPLAHANCDIRVPGWLTVALGDITREAVLAAIAEYDRLGQEAFLHRHGFDRARQYVLLHDGKRYDSKAIVGVAHGYLPGEAMLTSSEFSGGRATVGPAANRARLPCRGRWRAARIAAGRLDRGREQGHRR